MKITITIDATPEEVRQTMGLPDLNEVYKVLLSQMSEHVQHGTLDPEKVMELLEPSMKAGQQIMETLMRNMGSVMKASTPNSSASYPKQDPSN